MELTRFWRERKKEGPPKDSDHPGDSLASKAPTFLSFILHFSVFTGQFNANLIIQLQITVLSNEQHSLMVIDCITLKKKRKLEMGMEIERSVGSLERMSDSLLMDC